MACDYSRREFVKHSVTAVLGAGNLDALAELGPASAGEAHLQPHDVRLRPEIEPLVRLIETTPRQRIVAAMIEQLRQGVSYRQFLAALFLSAARLRVSPHLVYVIHSAHQISLDASGQDRLLPLFWALDRLHDQAGEGGRFPRLNLALVPTIQRAAGELNEAMQKFDAERAEAALLALMRNEGPKPAMNRLWHYVARDSSNIGHRAIAFVGAWRTLETIGWEHAEPLCQFVIRELNDGKHTPALYRTNVERAEKAIAQMPPDWAGERADRRATLELLALIHAGNAAGACEWAFDALRKGRVQAQTIWDAVFLGAAELMLRFNTYAQLPARPLHTTTSMNALNHAFHVCGDAKTRLYTLLMAVDWTANYVATERDRHKLRDLSITAIPDVKAPQPPAQAIEAIFTQQPVRQFDEQRGRYTSEYIGKREDMDQIVRMTYAYARSQKDHRPFSQAALHFTCLKATENAHDLKLPAAMFENYRLVSPEWRPHLIACTMHWLHGSRAKDNAAVVQAREALGRR